MTQTEYYCAIYYLIGATIIVLVGGITYPSGDSPQSYRRKDHSGITGFVAVLWPVVLLFLVPVGIFWLGRLLGKALK